MNKKHIKTISFLMKSGKNKCKISSQISEAISKVF